jgi:hypothetical protein
MTPSRGLRSVPRRPRRLRRDEDTAALVEAIRAHALSDERDAWRAAAWLLEHRQPDGDEGEDTSALGEPV